MTLRRTLTLLMLPVVAPLFVVSACEEHVPAPILPPAISESDGSASADASDGGEMEAGATEAGAEGGAGLPSGRPAALACARPSPRPAGNAVSDAGADASTECALDTECTAKADGRCNELRADVWHGGASLGTRCTYDACTTDGDCASGVCGCALGFAGQNVCLSKSGCRVDADCGASQVCSLSVPFILSDPGVIVTGDEEGGGGGHPREALGWFCTTTNDECRPGERRDGGATEGCVYAPDLGRWTWWYQP